MMKDLRVRRAGAWLIFCWMLAGAMGATHNAQAQGTNAGNISGAAGADVWWKHAVVYEIYPRSYQDSNGDGIGDLNGITQRLDYIQKTGIDAIWIAPMYPSPQVDFGYDISNYEAVDPQYGTMADFDRLLYAAKTHNVRIILDMVLNHTSDKHQWFIESASSRTNPKHDWYMWNDGVDANGPNVTAYQKKYEHEGKVPPNNWISGFGGSAWTWVPAVHQFYYHRFYAEQPDLNWRNPAVEKAMFDSMRFWLDKGVAGFRLDAIPTLFEDPELRDNAVLRPGMDAAGDPHLDDKRTDNLPGVHDVIRRMRAMVAKYPGDRVLIGETYLPNTAELDKWYGGAAHDELQLPMDMLLGFHGDHDKLDVASFRTHINEVMTQTHGGQPLLVFDNHDNVRAINRYGDVDSQHRGEINKALDTVLFTLPATALTYYGEELGMVTTTPTRKEDVQDPVGRTKWPEDKGRDGERTPMQWTPGPQAGFSTNPHTWLPVAADYKTVNVEVESKDPASQLAWFRKLTGLRRSNPALHAGDLTLLDTANNTVLSYMRGSGKGAVVVAVNFTGEPQTVSLPVAGGVMTLATDAASLQGVTSTTKVTLPAYASWVAQVQ